MALYLSSLDEIGPEKYIDYDIFLHKVRMGQTLRMLILNLDDEFYFISSRKITRLTFLFLIKHNEEPKHNLGAFSVQKRIF